MPLDRESRILDLGCGDGSLLRLLQDLGYRHAEGVDVSEEQVDAARAKGLSRITHADLLDYLEARPGAFDAVVALDVLEHLTRDEMLRALDALHAALRPGGCLVLRLPNAEGPFFGRIRYGDVTHETAFTESSIAQILRIAGFAEVSVSPVRPPPFGPFGAIRAVLWRCLEAAAFGWIAIETGNWRRWPCLTLNLMARAVRPGAQ